MPIYEYHCPQCRRDFEILIRPSERVQCPTCASPRLEKKLSVPAAHRGASNELSVCETPSPGGCGLPQCGMGGCQL